MAQLRFLGDYLSSIYKIVKNGEVWHANALIIFLLACGTSSCYLLEDLP